MTRIGRIIAVSVALGACTSPSVSYVKPWAAPDELQRVAGLCRDSSSARLCMESYGWHQDLGYLGTPEARETLRQLGALCAQVDSDPEAKCLYLRMPNTRLGEDNLRLAAFFDTPDAAHRQHLNLYGAVGFFCLYAEFAQEQFTADIVYSLGPEPTLWVGQEHCGSFTRDDARRTETQWNATWCRLTRRCSADDSKNAARQSNEADRPPPRGSQ